VVRRLLSVAAMFSLARSPRTEIHFAPDGNPYRMEVRCSMDSVRGRNCTEVHGMFSLAVGGVHFRIVLVVVGERFESTLNCPNQGDGWCVSRYEPVEAGFYT
jgi:hypothetical protein